MTNKLDEKRRPEVGIQDIDNYEFGGLEIDNKLSNGYQLYIPYGIHCELFKAIQDSIRLMQNQKEECEDNIKELMSNADKLEEKYKTLFNSAMQIQKDSIERINKDLKILEKIEPLINEV